MDEKIKKMVSRLNLKWEVSFKAVQDCTCRILSDSVAKSHAVTVDPSTIADAQRMRYLLGHELCHAALAEQIDVAFATMAFTRQHTPAACRAAFYAFILPCDWWVNALRHSIWPELTRIEIAANKKEAESALRAGLIDDAMAGEPLLMLAMAMNIAENELYGLGFDAHYKQVGKDLRNATRCALKTTKEFLLSLPPLASTRTEALKQLEAAVQKAAQLQGTPPPKLMVSDQQARWLL